MTKFSNPDGRPNGTYGKHRKRIELALAREDYEPYEENIKVAKGLKVLLAKKWAANDDPGVLDVSNSLAKVNDSLCTYAYPRIKSVEVTTDRDIVESLPLEAQIAMAREFAQMIGFDFVQRKTNGSGNPIEAHQG